MPLPTCPVCKQTVFDERTPSTPIRPGVGPDFEVIFCTNCGTIVAGGQSVAFSVGQILGAVGKIFDRVEAIATKLAIPKPPPPPGVL
jgi:hypothetical protein